MDKRIVILGVQEQGLDIAKHLKKNGYEISCLVTISESLAQKNRASGWVDYQSFANQHGIEVYYCNTYSLKKDLDFFQRQNFDLAILGGWQRLISEDVLSTFKLGCIGQHGSSEFLPRGRGRSPINWCIIQGKKRMIWNIFFLKPGVDDGDLIDYEVFDINEYDTCKTIYYKVSISVKNMITRSLPKLFNGELVTRKQVGTPTYYEKRTPDQGRINWEDSVFDINNLIRAVTHPYPGAYSLYKEFEHSEPEKIMIWKAQVWDTHLSFYYEKQYGEIVEIFSDGEYAVKCSDGLLLITESTDTNLFVGKIYA